MNWRERRRFLSPKHTGLVLAPGCRLSAPESFRNLALVAPTGEGKTTHFVIPNVLAVQGSVVVTDPAGEIHATTSEQLCERGFRIQLLQPANLEESLRFNPLSSWRSPRQLRQLATILARNTAGARSDPFWSLSAVNLLFLVLTAVARSDKARRTLSTARDVLNRLGMEGKDGAESFSQPTSV